MTDTENGGEIRRPDGTILIFELTNASGRIVPSTWHPEFGRSVPNACLEYAFNGPEAELQLRWN